MSDTKKTYVKIFLLSFVFFFFLSRAARVPLVYPDEAGYIGWARLFLNGVGDGLRYLPGYSLFLVPIFAVAEDIVSAFPVITTLNALLTAFFAVEVYRLSGRLGFCRRGLITAAVCLYPAVGLYVNFSMCESLLNLGFVLLAEAVILLSEDINSPKRWVLPVALSAFLCITHSRCIALLPALVLCLLPVVYKEGRRGIKALYFSVLSIGCALALLLVGYLFFNTETVNAAHLAGQIAGLFSLKGAFSFVATLISQMSYLVLSTFGFIAVGLYYTVKLIKAHRTGALFILLSFCFTAVLSAVFMYHHENPAHILYGRYNEYTVYAVLLVGFAGFLEGKSRFLVAGLSFLTCVVTALLYSGELSGIDLNMTHTWGVYLYKAFLYSFSYIPVAVVFFAISAAVFLAARKKPELGIRVLCGIFLVTTLFAEYDYFYKGASPRKETPQLVSLLEGEQELCVAALTGNSMVYPWEYFNYTVYNPGLTHSEDARLVLSEDKCDLTLLGAEKYSRLKLYSRSGGRAVDLSGVPEAELKAGMVDGIISVTVKNNGSPWLCKAAADTITEAVRVGMRVYKDGELIDEARCDFADNVYKTGYAEFDFPYPDGEYTLVFEAVRELLHRSAGVTYSLEKQGEKISLLPAEPLDDEPGWEFDPLDITGAEGFYRYYVTEGGAKIPGLYIEGELLELETYGEHPQLKVEVLADGVPLKPEGFKDGSYFYRLSGVAKELEIRSETYPYCENRLSFLTTESNFKPVDWFVRGMKKVFGVRLDHRRYGVDIKKIKIHREVNYE